jgi:hypothetical protein
MKRKKEMAFFTVVKLFRAGPQVQRQELKSKEEAGLAFRSSVPGHISLESA